MIDNWGCNPELSLTGGLGADELLDFAAEAPNGGTTTPNQIGKPMAALAAQAVVEPVMSKQFPGKPSASKSISPPADHQVIANCQSGGDYGAQSLAQLSEAALQVIAGNPRAMTKTLSWLGLHQNPEIRATVARNGNALPETVWLLAKDHDQSVRLAIAEHLESNRNVLQSLTCDSSPLVSWHAKNTLSLLAGEPKGQGLSRHPKGHVAVQKFDDQEQSSDHLEFLLLIAQKATTPARRLVELARHADAKIRAAVAENANAPIDALWLLSGDPVTEVKVKLAQNDNCPLEIIESLTNDSDQYVVGRARSVLNDLTGQTIADDSSAQEHERIGRRFLASG